MASSEAEWWPSPDDVAAILRARTKPSDGQSHLGVFNANTRPTADEVEALISQVGGQINAVFAAAEIPETSWEAAKQAAVLKTAYLIELSYFPEQGEETSPSTALRILSDAAMTTLINGANVRAFFSETEADE